MSIQTHPTFFLNFFKVSIDSYSENLIDVNLLSSFLLTQIKGISTSSKKKLMILLFLTFLITSFSIPDL